MARGIAEWSRAPWWRPTVRVLAVLAPLVTCAVLAAVRDEVTAETSVLLLVVWVVAAAATGDRWAGVLAAMSSGASFDFFLTQPYLAFTIDDADDVEATVLLVLISLAVTEIALWGHRQQQQAGLPSDEYVVVPVRRGRRVVGHFLVTSTSRATYPSREQRRVAVLLADQVAAALPDRDAT